MTSPAISVILPTHNRSSILPKAIESVRSQTLPDWELLIVDDGSTDATSEVVHRFVGQEHRIRYIRQNHAGLAAARNRGIFEGKGGYVAFLDDDDSWVPEKLAKQTAFMEAHPEYGLSYTRYRLVRMAGEKTGTESLLPTKLATTIEEFLKMTLFIPSSTVMARRELLIALNGFNPRYRISQDYELWLRFALRYRIGTLEAPLTVMTNDGRQRLSGVEAENRKAVIQILEDLGPILVSQGFGLLRKQKLAQVHFALARNYREEGRDNYVARHFFKALCIDPRVGAVVSQFDQKGVHPILQTAKAYGAVPWCLLKGVFHAGR